MRIGKCTKKSYLHKIYNINTDVSLLSFKKAKITLFCLFKDQITFFFTFTHK